MLSAFSTRTFSSAARSLLRFQAPLLPSHPRDCASQSQPGRAAAPKMRRRTGRWTDWDTTGRGAFGKHPDRRLRPGGQRLRVRKHLAAGPVAAPGDQHRELQLAAAPQRHARELGDRRAQRRQQPRPQQPRVRELREERRSRRRTCPVASPLRASRRQR
jgi:hypothetical protein